MTANPKARVLIVQAEIKQYRSAFFTQLHAALAKLGIALTIAYSNVNEASASKGDTVELPKEISRKVKGKLLARGRLLYQNILSEVLKNDLIIVEQASKNLNNYGLLLLSRLGLKQVAFWGHGRNLQGTSPRFAEWLKHATINSVDWWFAYTSGTAKYLIGNQVPSEKITVVQNAIDTTAFRKQCELVQQHDLAEVRDRLGISDGDHVGIFCGGLYSEKRLEFLINAAVAIRERIPDFHLIVLGAGPDRELMETANRRFEWVHYIGPSFGVEKARLFRVADIYMMPGLVGLGILDAFVAGLPLITTDIPIHSPEIEYLQSGVNGLMLPDSLEAYTNGIVDLLKDTAGLERLKCGAAESAAKFSLEAMVENFCGGILGCLAERIEISKAASQVE